MGILKLNNGMEIDVSGGLRVLELEDRILVIGQEMAIRVNSVQEGWEEIRKQKRLPSMKVAYHAAKNSQEKLWKNSKLRVNGYLRLP